MLMLVFPVALGVNLDRLLEDGDISDLVEEFEEEVGADSVVRGHWYKIAESANLVDVACSALSQQCYAIME